MKINLKEVLITILFIHEDGETKEMKIKVDPEDFKITLKRKDFMKYIQSYLEFGKPYEVDCHSNTQVSLSAEGTLLSPKSLTLSKTQ